jgi:hypothetical protein
MLGASTAGFRLPLEWKSGPIATPALFGRG